ncbi:Ycf2, putative [Medicago truncatula]|uniref:Ycf2, putative n=1 Tax=Medicago truncatula TaxID=3880 RepID=G7J5Q7_MEDTR|nr:Ycf2, putative [Medicago truncatula]
MKESNNISFFFELFCLFGQLKTFGFYPNLMKKNDGIISYRFLENDYDLVHDLLEIESGLLGTSKTNRLTLLKNPLNVIQNGSCSIIYEIGNAYF